MDLGGEGGRRTTLISEHSRILQKPFENHLITGNGIARKKLANFASIFKLIAMRIRRYYIYEL